MVGVAVSPIFLLFLYQLGFSGTGNGLSYDLGSFVGDVALYGGMILGLYYLVRHERKRGKEKQTTKTSS